LRVVVQYLSIFYQSHRPDLIFLSKLDDLLMRLTSFCTEIVKFNVISLTLMNSNNRINYNKDRTKATAAAIPMVGAIVTAALLLSGLSLIGSSCQLAIAQQDMTTGGGSDTTTGGGTEGGTTTGGGNATTDSATPQGGNATTIAGGAGGGNDSMSQIRMHLEEARTALQNNDTQGAMMHLDLAYNALGGAGALQGSNMTAADTTAGGATNMTTTGGTEGGAATNATTGGTEGGGVLEGIFGGGGQ
jgi:hypothetical protein